MNLFNKSKIGLVLDTKFHRKNRWVSAFTPYFIEAFIKEFNPIIISSQLSYEWHKKKLKHVFSLEPGWGAPMIKFDKKLKQTNYVFISDPQNKTEWFEDYIQQKNINYLISMYFNPFIKHFPNFSKERLIHFPWAIPDQFISAQNIAVRSNEVAIFGGMNDEAYDVRRWCGEQDGVTKYANSGVENKIVSDKDYYKWLQGFDAVIAAGSSNPKYDLVTPKYLEIAATGALLIGQYCKDLEVLGLNEKNMLIFTKETFSESLLKYKTNPEKYLDIRKEGMALIKNRHLISHRIALLKELFSK
jgi:hypothetical protein